MDIKNRDRDKLMQSNGPILNLLLEKFYFSMDFSEASLLGAQSRCLSLSPKHYKDENYVFLDRLVEDQRSFIQQNQR